MHAKRIRPMQYAYFASTDQIRCVIYVGVQLRWRAGCLVSVGYQRAGRKVGCRQCFSFVELRIDLEENVLPFKLTMEFSSSKLLTA